MRIREHTVVRYVISGAALLLLGGHLVFPDTKIDAVTLGFLLIALVPWLSSIFESFELPGGWKVKYRPLKAAGDVLAASAERKQSEGSGSARVAGTASRTSPISDSDDPNLRLVSLRIEIEKRLRELGRARGIKKRTLPAQLAALTEAGLLDAQAHNSLALILEAGNKAAHGAQVSEVVGNWAAKVGPVILSYLDDKLREPKSN